MHGRVSCCEKLPSSGRASMLPEEALSSSPARASCGFFARQGLAAASPHELAPRAGRYNLRSSKLTTCCGSTELLMRRGECCFGGWRRCACGDRSDLVVLSSANLVAQNILCIDTFSISQGAVRPPADWIVLLRSVPFFLWLLMPQAAAADCVLVVVSSVPFLCL